MYEQVKLIDVTLRDGGYKNNFNFKKDFVEKVLISLNKSNIDYIEIGYKNGSINEIANIGPGGLCEKEYIKFCRQKLSNSKLTVMLHHQNVQESDFQEMQNEGVDAVRICFDFKNPVQFIKTIEIIKKYNFEVFVNFTRISRYNCEIINKYILQLISLDIENIYLADSNGSLTPKDIRYFFNYLCSNYNINLGYHAHDNLFLASSNAIAAIESGVKFIDSSIFGLGKGGGNLRTEAIVSFLHTLGNNKYDICEILAILQYVQENFSKEEEYNKYIKVIINGIFDMAQDELLLLNKNLSIKDHYSQAEQIYSNIINIRKMYA
jgi:4-hydroxy 2-oxovalerate aldolase